MVRVEAPARLHLGMLAAASDGARRFGGLGVAVDRPAVVIEAEPASDLSAEGPDAERALMFARRCHEAMGLTSGAHLRVVQAIPHHIGLGSGTKLALAVAKALAVLGARELDRSAAAGREARAPRAALTRELDTSALAEAAGRAARAPEAALTRGLDAPALAEAAGRAARSAVGMWTFALGGLVVEGGVRRDRERPAPLLARYEMPEEWRCVLVFPAAEPGLSGPAEEEAFARLAPAPEHSAAIAQLVLTALLPALVERDVAEFGAALTRVQELVGDSFAAVQGGRFHPRASGLVEALLDAGAAGAGQSSWGPAVYGIAGSEAAAHELADRMAGAGTVEIVGFDNRGARTEVR